MKKNKVPKTKKLLSIAFFVLFLNSNIVFSKHCKLECIINSAGIRTCMRTMIMDDSDSIVELNRQSKIKSYQAVYLNRYFDINYYKSIKARNVYLSTKVELQYQNFEVIGFLVPTFADSNLWTQYFIDSVNHIENLVNLDSYSIPVKYATDKERPE